VRDARLTIIVLQAFRHFEGYAQASRQSGYRGFWAVNAASSWHRNGHRGGRRKPRPAMTGWPCKTAWRSGRGWRETRLLSLTSELVRTLSRLRLGEPTDNVGRTLNAL
jgi:hypothetical protein